MDNQIQKRKPTDVPVVSGLSDIKISRIRTRAQIYALLGFISVASSNFGSKIRNRDRPARHTQRARWTS